MKAIELEIKGAFKMARDLDCIPLTAKKHKRIEWLQDKEVYSVLTNMGERIMTPITIKPKNETEAKKPTTTYLMDVITGTLYNPKTNICLTSDVIRLIKYKIDPEHGKKVVNMKIERGD